MLVTRRKANWRIYCRGRKHSKEKVTKDEFELTVYAKFRDPDVNDIVSQGFTYPFAIVKTNLNQMPGSIKLEVEYEE